MLQLQDASGLRTAPLASGSTTAGTSVTAAGSAGKTVELVAAGGTVTVLERSITTEADGSAAAEHQAGLLETEADPALRRAPAGRSPQRESLIAHTRTFHRSLVEDALILCS